MLLIILFLIGGLSLVIGFIQVFLIGLVVALVFAWIISIEPTKKPEPKPEYKTWTNITLEAAVNRYIDNRENLK